MHFQPEFILAKLLVRLFLEWRGWAERLVENKAAHDSLGLYIEYNVASHCEKDVLPMKHLITFLQECVNCGGEIIY